jgi:hypothetical protein
MKIIAPTDFGSGIMVVPEGGIGHRPSGRVAPGMPVAALVAVVCAVMSRLAFQPEEAFGVGAADLFAGVVVDGGVSGSRRPSCHRRGRQIAPRWKTIAA